jgi:RNA polymerase sigma-70 factor (ECF subfamily)
MVDESFNCFFSQEYPAVVAAVQRIVNRQDIAEEVAQEAFCRALEKWTHVETHESPGGWVQLTALRLAVRRERRSQHLARILALFSRDAPDHQPTPTDVDLERALKRLSLRQRQAVILHYTLDLSVVDTAGLMGLQPGTVKAHLSRARATLESALSTQGED